MSSNKGFFPEPPEINPQIYAYTQEGDEYKGLLKIGYTTQTIDVRMKQHFPTLGPNSKKPYKVVFLESSVRNDGSFFKDFPIHKILTDNGFERPNGEWFSCSVDDLKAAFIAVKENKELNINRVYDFDLRPEQKSAITLTKNYFTNIKAENNKPPHFLWNCKMRFGKTFTTYKLAKEMNWKRVLILTFKPAVQNSWKEDLLMHTDFEEWQFISRGHKSFDDTDKNRPFVCFASFQDFLGKSKSGGIKIKNEWAHTVDWDCIVLDEYHFGAWRDSARELVGAESNEDLEEAIGNQADLWNEEISPLKTKHYLYLSGTPFRALSSGEFIEEQIFNWTYLDEQSAKLNWNGKNNPYRHLPRMVMMTYQLPESAYSVIDTGEFDEFSLNEFFKAEGEGSNAKFLNENEVQKWIDMIRGVGFETIYSNLKSRKDIPVLPFYDSKLNKILRHTLWYLPSIAACEAMKALLEDKGNDFFSDYEIILAAGKTPGIGVKALEYTKSKMGNPLKSKTITLTCGKLVTGVTVKPWTGIFMLRNTTSPETYFQAAFRVQSPWIFEPEESVESVIKSENEINSNGQSYKEECYIFDFAPSRALRLITDYSCRLDVGEINPEKKVNDFIKFLPVICFDGSYMKEVSSSEVLDIGLVGTSGSQLAKKFESPRLVNVDDDTLKKLLDNKKALEALMRIEAFRNLNQDLEKIISNSERVKELKTTDDEEIEKKQKKELTEKEKETKSLRKKVQEKLQKFSSRIPVFMYLTDYREETLKDVITKLEPGLFEKVTGLTVEDFELLISLSLFNASLMNSAIFSFKRYENSSLYYAGGFTKFEPEKIGLFDTSISSEEFKSIKI